MDRSGTKKCDLFSPLTIRGVTLKNRIAVSPMCQYSSVDGKATDWHLVHLGSRAIGGASLVIMEATAVEAIGRISPDDMGIWSDDHIEPLQRITKYFKDWTTAVPGIQLAHAGRKASTQTPWKGRKFLNKDEGGWDIVGPSPIPFNEGYQTPHELSEREIESIIQSFRLGAKRALAAGFRVFEVHSAHGYLLHSFLSPISNQRVDKYGGSLENRMRLTVAVSEAVRNVIPEDLPLFVRISAVDYIEGGWDIEQSVQLAHKLKEVGVDLIDCSSGFVSPQGMPDEKPLFQVAFAEQIKKEAGIMTGAVGKITTAEQAEKIVEDGSADLVLLARASLRNPYWALDAAKEMDVEVDWAPQYLRGKLGRS